MLSLPLIPPQPDLHRPPFAPRGTSPPRNLTSETTQHPHQRPRHEKPTQKPTPTTSPLALLAADEAAIAHRKAAIRNFGAYWIRPPGVPKTLQAQREEEAEQAEQDELMRQEQGLRDLQARQEVEEARGRAAQAVEVEGEERDLDEDIPDADAAVDGDGEGGEVTFNEDSLLQNSSRHSVEDGVDEAEREEAELTGAARDEEALGLVPEERNLDDSIPEAGSYQHTDTEAEDSSDLVSTSSDSEGGQALRDSFAAQSARRRQQQRQVETPPVTMTGSSAQQAGTGRAGRLQQRIRAQTGGEPLTRSPGSLNLSSSLLESSFVGSSPVVQRGRGGGARGRRGRSS